MLLLKIRLMEIILDNVKVLRCRAPAYVRVMSETNKNESASAHLRAGSRKD